MVYFHALLTRFREQQSMLIDLNESPGDEGITEEYERYDGGEEGNGYCNEEDFGVVGGAGDEDDNGGSDDGGK